MLILLSLLACSQQPDPPAPVTYTVVRGDTLWKIAQQHGVSVEALQTRNGLTTDRIDVGLVLTIPDGAQPAVASAAVPSSRRRSGGGGGASVPPPATTTSALHMPAAQPCLSGPADVGEGDAPEMVASAGLSLEQVRGAMDAFVGQTARCIPEGGWPEGVISLELTVACSGQVAEVHVAHSGGIDAAIVSCVQDTLRYAPFPAHDMPDGFSFTYPLRFSAP